MVDMELLDWKVAQAWPTSSEKFVAVQNILDRNKLLIKEINANHDSASGEGLEHNVALIRELNDNILKVVGLYKDISSSFFTAIGVAGSTPPVGT